MNRKEWLTKRIELENSFIKRLPFGKRFIKTYDIFHILVLIFYFLLKITFVAKIGIRNSLKLKLKYFTHKFLNLADGLNGLTILHLSDLHLDESINIKDILSKKLMDISEVDLIVMTGDYASSSITDETIIQDTVDQIAIILNNIKSKYGVYAVLGNHDGHLLVEPLEAIGVTVLINEYSDLTINNDNLRIIGTDDVNSFYTKNASEVLKQARNKFSICLVHSPELFEEASIEGADLYLCGHTHGGQICLPGGIPIISHSSVSRRYTKGLWSYRGMIGYTSSGIGVSAVPLRYNSRPEIIIHILSK